MSVHVDKCRMLVRAMFDGRLTAREVIEAVRGREPRRRQLTLPPSGSASPGRVRGRRPTVPGGTGYIYRTPDTAGRGKRVSAPCRRPQPAGPVEAL